MPDHCDVHEKYVNEFHAALNVLAQSSGIDLREFRIPPTEVRRVETGGNYLTGETDYSVEDYCERNFLLMKIDGVLNLFEIYLSPQKPEIGFRPPS